MQVGAHQLQGTADVLLRQLEAADRRDVVAEKKSGRFGCLMAACIVLALVTLPFAAGIPPVLLVTAALIVGAVVFGVKRAKEKKYDLDDRKLETALRVLKVLRTDIPTQEVVTLKIDFQDYRVGGRQVSKEGGWMSSLRTYEYEHAWFDLSARLADGNVVAISVTDDVQRKEKSKRKYTKVRERVSSDVTLTLKLREGAGEEIQARLTGAPPGLAVRRLAGQGAHLRVALTSGPMLTQKGRSGTSTTGQPVGAEALLGALLWVYGAVAPPAKAA